MDLRQFVIPGIWRVSGVFFSVRPLRLTDYQYSRFLKQGFLRFSGCRTRSNNESPHELAFSAPLPSPCLAPPVGFVAVEG